MNKMQFTFSDVIAGYVTSVNTEVQAFNLKTPDGREFQIKLTTATYGELIRNLGEPYQDLGQPVESALKIGIYLFVAGIFYPEHDDYTVEAKHIIFTGRTPGDYRFETPDWWIHQIQALAEFYLHAQFPDGKINYDNYRTQLTLEGQKIDSTRQETDTISRMVYGFATAYLLTGNDRYLEAAEKGTTYLHDHMRAVDENEEIVYWYHGTDRVQGKDHKILASQFGDDYDAIPAYEQIYALAGPLQTYRVTGNPSILRDAEMTINLFDKFFLDREKGGYFSHVDPVAFNPRAEALNQDRARKNWNSVGDHAPAYLINLWLATGEERYANFLINTADTIVKYFPDYEHSPLVQEKFHEDWSHDTTWGWQQNRGVVGHNLKIAWNLMRINSLRPHTEYVELAQKIATIIPTVGMDKERGGWYDVMERLRNPGEEWQRFVWHDRKAWWQQEQAILAYLILGGILKKPEYQSLARETEAFYNAFFPDQDNGGVYFNVLANGTPFLTGTERLKGSHSMSGYHSFELCYLASVYTNLLITKQPMDFYFKPQVDAFKGNILRIQPDILPPGSVKIEQVWIDGAEYRDFDATALTIKLPSKQNAGAQANRPAWSGSPTGTTQKSWNVRVRLMPAQTLFDSSLDIAGDLIQLVLYGELNDLAVPAFKINLDKIIELKPKRLVLRVERLTQMSAEAARELSFMLQKLNLNEDIAIVGTSAAVKETLQHTQVWEDLHAVEKYQDLTPVTHSPRGRRN